MSWVAVLAAWCMVATPVALLAGRFLRRCQLLAQMRAEEICAQAECDRAATHDQFTGATTDGIPIVSPACHVHGGGGWPR